MVQIGPIISARVATLAWDYSVGAFVIAAAHLNRSVSNSAETMTDNTAYAGAVMCAAVRRS